MTELFSPIDPVTRAVLLYVFLTNASKQLQHWSYSYSACPVRSRQRPGRVLVFLQGKNGVWFLGCKVGLGLLHNYEETDRTNSVAIRLLIMRSINDTIRSLYKQVNYYSYLWSFVCYWIWVNTLRTRLDLLDNSHWVQSVTNLWSSAVHGWRCRPIVRVVCLRVTAPIYPGVLYMYP